MKKIPIEQWRKDHWSTFAYAHHCAINFEGHLDPIRMRTDGNTYPTRLKNDIEVKGHNDYNCLEDLENNGFLIMTTGLGQHITITDKGFDAMKQLSKHKANGGQFSTFLFMEMRKHSIEEIAKATRDQLKKGVKPIIVDIAKDMPDELTGEYISSCPICLKLIKVYFVEGSMWVDTCSEECGKIYWKLEKQKNGVSK